MFPSTGAVLAVETTLATFSDPWAFIGGQGLIVAWILELLTLSCTLAGWDAPLLDFDFGGMAVTYRLRRANAEQTSTKSAQGCHRSQFGTSRTNIVVITMAFQLVKAMIVTEYSHHVVDY